MTPILPRPKVGQHVITRGLFMKKGKAEVIRVIPGNLLRFERYVLRFKDGTEKEYAAEEIMWP